MSTARSGSDARGRAPGRLVAGGLLVALIIGMGVANFADPDPDGLERAVIDTQCRPDADEQECLADVAGDPVFRGAPVPDYEVTWLSGLLGVTVCFAVAAGVVVMARGPRRRVPDDAPGPRAEPGSQAGPDQAEPPLR